MSHHRFEQATERVLQPLSREELNSRGRALFRSLVSYTDNPEILLLIIEFSEPFALCVSSNDRTRIMSVLVDNCNDNELKNDYQGLYNKETCNVNCKIKGGKLVGKGFELTIPPQSNINCFKNLPIKTYPLAFVWNEILFDKRDYQLCFKVTCQY